MRDRSTGTPSRISASGGLANDPDTAVPERALCATVNPDGDLLAVLLDALDNDTLHGLGDLHYGLVLPIGGEDANRDLDQYAAKSLRVAPRIPEAATANTNPRLDHIDATIGDCAPVAPPLVRCAENPRPCRWREHQAAALAGRADGALWIIQRDERLGVHAYESCVRVTP